MDDFDFEEVDEVRQAWYAPCHHQRHRRGLPLEPQSRYKALGRIAEKCGGSPSGTFERAGR
jgi:hypothetical protein